MADKISAVIALHNTQSPGVPLSVNSLALQAGVSRANLYASHPDIIASLRRPKAGDSETRAARRLSRATDLREELEAVKKANKALLMLNDALRNENRRLKQRLADKPSQKSKRKTNGEAEGSAE